jgi:hypothetical protein
MRPNSRYDISCTTDLVYFLRLLIEHRFAKTALPFMQIPSNLSSIPNNLSSFSSPFKQFLLFSTCYATDLGKALKILPNI